MNPEERSETSAGAADSSLGAAQSGGAGGGEVPDLLPVLPLRNTVLFPGTLNPITVGRAESLQMIDENLSDSRVFGVFTQRDPKVDAPGGDDLFRVGVSAKVVKLQRDGVLRLVLPGGSAAGADGAAGSEVAAAHGSAKFGHR